tara:strand:+ start:489 stop:1538 length:1050 start_codon:yes stop_codon:yes gene_type:complete
MKILVTGGCGFIGSNFVLRQLEIHQNQVLNLDKLTYAGNIDNLTTIKNHRNYQFFQGDICDLELVESLIGDFKPDVLVHFAAETHVDRSLDNSEKFILTNVLGTSNLLNASLKHSMYNKSFLFVHISTDEVFGSLGKDGFFNENTPYSPKSPYSASKASSDHLVRSWKNSYNLPVIITNCSNNYGPFQFPEKLIPLIITNCIDERILPVYGTGENIRDWLYVNDHCDAINKVISKGVVGETYLIGGNNEIKNIEIVKKICSILDNLRPRQNGESYKSLIKLVEDRPGHDFRYAIDCQKIHTELEWEPKESFRNGLEKTILWYLDNEEWWRKIQKKNHKQERLGLKKFKS